MPTTAPLLIVVNGLDVTASVPYESLRIHDEAGAYVGQANFTIKNAKGLAIGKRDRVIILNDSYTAILFYGFVTEWVERRRGVQTDLDLTCSDEKLRLQKSVVTPGLYTGSDLDILEALIENTYPDLSNEFDVWSYVESLNTDLELDISDDSFLDAIEKLARLTGAKWRYTPSADPAGSPALINWSINPSLENNLTGTYAGMYNDFYGIMPGANVTQTTGGTWGTYAMQMVAVDLLATKGYYLAQFSMGRDSAADTTHRILLSKHTGYVVRLSTYAKRTAGSTPFEMVFSLNIFDTEGNNIPLTSKVPYATNSGSTNLLASTTLTTGWVQYWANIDLTGLNDLPDQFYLEPELHLFGNSGWTMLVDGIMVNYLEDAGHALITAPDYFDGSFGYNFRWMGDAHNSPSYKFFDRNQINWKATPTAAPFDADVDSDTVEDLEVIIPDFDGINSLIVIGGYAWADVDFEYPGDAQLTHFDLEERFYPAEGGTQVVIYKNTGTDGTPTWTAQTVGVMDEDVLGGGIDVVHAAEKHWVQFETAPADLTRAWRVVGRRRYRIRVIVEDEQEIDTDNTQWAETYYDDTITSEEDAVQVGMAELQARAAPKQISWDTYEPGAEVGTTITVTDSDRGLADTVIIKRITTRWLGGSGHVQVHIEGGTSPPDLGDILYSQQSTPRVGGQAEFTQKTLNPLYNDSGDFLTNNDVQYLYAEVV